MRGGDSTGDFCWSPGLHARPGCIGSDSVAAFVGASATQVVFPVRDFFRDCPAGRDHDDGWSDAARRVDFQSVKFQQCSESTAALPGLSDGSRATGGDAAGTDCDYALLSGAGCPGAAIFIARQSSILSAAPQNI
jgi:hypothetical protein